MAGLSIVLESQDATKIITTSASNIKSAQVVNKVISIINIPTPPPSPSSTSTLFKSPFPRCTFLDHCFLCKRTLLPTEDIYMYKGDKAFCSVECRWKQISMDEQEDELKMKKMRTTTETPNNNNNNGRDKYELAAARRPPMTSSPCLRKPRYN